MKGERRRSARLVPDKAEKIIRTETSLFFQKGYLEMTANEIARKSRISKEGHLTTETWAVIFIELAYIRIYMLDKAVDLMLSLYTKEMLPSIKRAESRTLLN